MFNAFSKVMPIFILLIMGFTIRRKGWASIEVIDTLKKGIIYLCLPAVLFLSFKNMDLSSAYITISVVTFTMLIVFFMAGLAVMKLSGSTFPVLPFLVTGTSFGLLGLPLFAGVYGIENAGVISVFGVGHEIFAWFVYLPLVKGRLDGQALSKDMVKGFIQSPVILAILAGLAVNLSGVSHLFDRFVILKGMELTMTSISAMTTPLILIVIGYGIHLDRAYMGPAYKMLAVRLVVMLTIGYLIRIFVIGPVIGQVSPMFEMAYFTFLVLPPPFSLEHFCGGIQFGRECLYH